MASMDPIKHSLESSFESEKLVRLINDCTDLEELRQMALLLVQQLAQQKAARAWMATRASESENSKLEMLAEMIRHSQGEASQPEEP